MPSVTVKLAHTQKPDDCTIYSPSSDEGSGITVDYGNGTVEITRSYVNQPISKTLSFTPAEALALAEALVLVAGCADTRWRGWHWEAREANGQLLATTPPGEWYARREDCETAVITLFGDRSEVVMGPGAPVPGGELVLVLREPAPDPIDGPTIKPELTVRALRDIAKLHAPVKLRGDDRSVCADCGGFYPCPTVALIPETTATPDDDADEYPVGKVEL